MVKDKINKGKFKFVKSWQFPGKVSAFILEDLLPKLDIKEEDLCHCFCGTSEIGKLRIDIDRKNKPDVVADVTDLPDLLGKGSQKNILADPPWEIPYHKRIPRSP